VVGRYAVDVIRSMTGGTQPGRLYDDNDLRAAFGRKGRVADIAVD
jgi:hypothetical protein